MKCVVFAWAEFIGGLVFLGLCDYGVRWRFGWLDSHGSPTPDVIWFGVPFLLGAVAVLLLWRATSRFSRIWLRVTAVAAQLLIGFVAYVVMCFLYVVGTGVDCL